MVGNVEHTFRHLSVLANPDDPFEMAFENFDLVINQGDRPRNTSKHDKC